MRRWRTFSQIRSITMIVSDDHQHDRAHVLVVVEADGLIELLADAAGADEADDGGRADVQLEPPQRVGGEVGQHLGQHGEADHLEPVAARRAHALELALVDVLVGLGEQLAQRARSCGR